MAKAKAKRPKNKSSVRRHPTQHQKLVALVAKVNKLNASGNYQESYDLLMAHLDTFGGHPSWLEHIGFACYHLQNIDDAHFYLSRSIDGNPKSATAHSYIGHVYFEMAEYLKALEHHKKAIALNPSTWQFYVNLASLTEVMGLYDQTLAALTVAFQKAPSEPRVMWAVSNLYLCFGRVEEGWKLYEAGFGCGKRTAPLPRNKAYWGGEDISDKTILVWREFGLGDEVRNAALYHDLTEVAGQVIIECFPKLTSILKRTFPKAQVIPQDNSLASIDRPHYDVHSGQASLHYHFRKDVQSYRTKAKPDGFLLPDPEKVAEWRRRFSKLNAQAVVGISWRSGLLHTHRTHYYFRLEEIGALLKTPGVAFVNMFYDEAEDEIRAAEQALGITLHRWEGVDIKNDLETTFAMTKALDLLISAPTSSADIGGAVGTPTWTILPKKHYTRLGEADMPAMPSLRIYGRQLNEPWGPTLRRITNDFRQWLSDRTADTLLSKTG